MKIICSVTALPCVRLHLKSSILSSRLHNETSLHFSGNTRKSAKSIFFQRNVPLRARCGIASGEYALEGIVVHWFLSLIPVRCQIMAPAEACGVRSRGVTGRPQPFEQTFRLL